jgi:hypothetical protein
MTTFARLAQFGPRLPTALGVVRTGLGAAMLVRPMIVPSPRGVDSITRIRLAWLARMLGARDLALGAGTLAAGAGGAGPWLAVSAWADAVDAVVLGRAVLRREVAPVTGALAAASAVGAVAAGVVALAERRRAPRSGEAERGWQHHDNGSSP